MSDQQKLFALEKRFWQAIVDVDAQTATEMLTEPAFMVSPMGVLKFDHEGYRKMAEQGGSQVKSFDLRDLHATFPSRELAIVSYTGHQVLFDKQSAQETTEDMEYTSTWLHANGTWRCVMHTQSPSRKQG